MYVRISDDRMIVGGKAGTIADFPFFSREKLRES